MSLSPQIWDALEVHGVTQEHLEMLLRLLVLQKNGSWTWHFVQGNMGHCDIRLTFPSRAAELNRICDTVVELVNSLR